MAESNGLLDLMKSPAAMGLLAAGFGGLAGANRNTPYNNLGRAGLAGLAGYSAADALQQKQRDQDKAAAIQAAIPTLYGADGKIDFQKGLALGMEPKFLQGMAELPNAGRTKVARTIKVPGADGGMVEVMVDEYGDKRGEMAGYVAPQLVDTGDKKQFVTPQAGQAYEVGLSPAEILENQRGLQSLALRQQNNQLLSDANDINKEGQRTQIVVGADGTNYRVDKGTGATTPIVTADGKPVMSGQAAEDARTRERDSNSADWLLTRAEELIPNATASGAGAIADAAAGYFGKSLPGSPEAAELESIGGALVLRMPRMEGPQSNADSLLYRQMAGRVGDRTVPVNDRLAALKVVRRLTTQYATPKTDGAQGNGGNLTNSQTPPANPQRTVTRTGMSDGRKVIKYSDGSVEYGD